MTYTTADLAYIRANPDKTDKEVAKVLGRSWQAIQSKRKRMGLVKGHNYQQGRTIKLTQLQRYAIERSACNVRLLSRQYGVTERYIRRIKKAA